MPSQSRTPRTTAAAAAPETSAAGPAVGAATDLQSTVGNSGVQEMIAAGPAVAGPAAAAPAAPPNWSKSELRSIQTELKRMGLYTIKVDGLFGPGTRKALDGAFGANVWGAMAAADTLTRLVSMPGASVEAPAAEAQVGTSTTGAAAGAAAAPSGPNAAPSFSKPEIMEMQRELKRLGLYRKGVDGDLGAGSKAAMVEAFGSDAWKTMSAGAIVARLSAAPTPAGDASKERFRYGEMAKDGLIDITLGVGFDEFGSHIAVIQAFQEALTTRGFGLNAGAAAQMYASAGRTMSNAEFGKYFVKRNALTYKPPAGDPKSVNAVVRLVDNGTGKDGAAAAEGFKDGLANSDIAYYAGHGRYGTGPDFDQNMTFDLLDEAGSVSQTMDDYEALEHFLKTEGRAAGRTAWQQFEWRVSKNRLNVNGVNEGNVYLNTKNPHGGEFGGKLMYWQLARSGGQGAELQTGAGGGLEERNAASPEHRYTMQVFNGCRTQDYAKALRATKGNDASEADVLATKRTVYWSDMAANMAAFVDSVLGQQSAEATINGMDQTQQTERPAGAAGAAWGKF